MHNDGTAEEYYETNEGGIGSWWVNKQKQKKIDERTRYIDLELIFVTWEHSGTYCHLFTPCNI